MAIIFYSLSLCVCVSVSVSVCVSVCTYVCLSIRMYVCMYVYIKNSKPQSLVISFNINKQIVLSLIRLQIQGFVYASLNFWKVVFNNLKTLTQLNGLCGFTKDFTSLQHVCKSIK